jgi:FMN phosphatase YigB (HAD superfamily)
MTKTRYDHYNVVSIDMFQTLVDVNRLRHHFWQKILGNNYSDSKVDEYSEQWSKLFPDHFNRSINQPDEFLCLKSIFETFWGIFFNQYNIDSDHRKASQVHVDVHRSAPPYKDTEIFLNTIREHFPICLVTDSDNEMIQPHLDKYSFDQIFISERLKAYKSDPENRMFHAVISHYPISPKKIFHIGDMYSDILGASKVGITTCWLNRDGQTWSHSVKPDYEVESLIEAAAILRRG